MNKYLNGNSLRWLLDKTDPHIRYLTLRDIMERDISSDEMIVEHSNLSRTDHARRLFKTERDGVIGDKKNFDIYYRGAMWFFAEAVEYGFDIRDGLVRNAAEFILDRCQMNSGGFSLNWKPEVEVACRTGDMIKYLILSGCVGDRVERGIEWIIKNQRHDGGWLHCPISGTCDMLKFLLFRRSGRGLKREVSIDVLSCLYATIACSMALVLNSDIQNRHRDAIQRAAEFFLRRRMFRSERDSETHIEAVRSWNRDFTQLGYPVLSQYDILYGLIFIARAGYFSDSRIGEAFNLIISKQDSSGRWMMESAHTGMLFGNMKKRSLMGRENKWITLNVLRMLKCAGFVVH
jgi:hypothetical protein